MRVCGRVNSLLQGMYKKNRYVSVVKYHLTDLLPFTDNQQLTTRSDRERLLRLLTFLCKLTQLATRSFMLGQFEDFDAQVSENLCQIRAYKLLLMADNSPNIMQQLVLIGIRCKEVQAKSVKLLADYQLIKANRLRNRSNKNNQLMSCKEFLHSEGFNLELTDEQYFLIQTFILSRYKIIDEHEICYGIDYSMLCAEMLISSKTFARKVVHRLQRNISQNSCAFIFKLLADLDSPSQKVYLLQKMYESDEVGRHILPCYEVTKIILEHASKFNRIIHVGVTRLFRNKKDLLVISFIPNDEQFNLTLRDQTEQPAILLFKGIMKYNDYMSESKEQYIQRFLKVGFLKIILANMAQHPQYAGLLLEDKKFNPYAEIDRSTFPDSYNDYIKSQENEFLKYKYLAGEIGCRPENLNLFLLTHIRCGNTDASLCQPALECTL